MHNAGTLMEGTMLGQAPSAQIALIIAAVTVGTLSTALAVGLDRTPGVESPQVVVSNGADLTCGPACSSHVIASTVPGQPAVVVHGASAFGLALDGGAALDDGRRDRPVPTLPGVQARAVGQVIVGPAGVFRGEGTSEPVRYTGGYAIAMR
jgi:hypothetical protein